MRPHPFVGLGFDRERSMRFWDDLSGVYSNAVQGDMPRRIVEAMSDMGVVGPESSVLEIGSGPGTYSVHLSKACGRLTCLDSSPGMMERLKAAVPDAEAVLADWNAFSAPKGFDTVVSSLAPTGSPESLLRMEDCSRECCASVSWVRNAGDSVSERIWHALGRDFGFEGRTTSPTLEWLEGNGRDHRVRVFSEDVVVEAPLDEMVHRETVAFRAYGIGEDVSEIVRDVLRPFTRDGIVRMEMENSLRLIVWRADREPRIPPHRNTL